MRHLTMARFDDMTPSDEDAMEQAQREREAAEPEPPAFDDLLSAMEDAADAMYDAPSDERIATAWSDARRAVLDHVARLERTLKRTSETLRICREVQRAAAAKAYRAMIRGDA